MLSRKHYVAIASKVASKVHNYETRQALASELAVIFAEDNPRFDVARFTEACNKDQGQLCVIAKQIAILIVSLTAGIRFLVLTRLIG